MSVDNRTPETDDQARLDLSRFIRDRAEQTKNEVGFTWIGTPSAPSTYQQLRGAFNKSTSTGAPLPISNLFCDSSIYPVEEDNVRFRFWHDVHHVKLGLSFRLEDELELALWHLDQAAQAGILPGSVTYELLEADLIGQVLLMALIRRFPIDQAEFVNTCSQVGLMTGLLDEIRRIP